MRDIIRLDQFIFCTLRIIIEKPTYLRKITSGKL